MSDKDDSRLVEGCVYGCLFLAIGWAVAVGVASVFWVWRVALGGSG